MRRRITIAIGVTTLVIGFYAAAAPPQGGHTADQLKKYFCFNAGPSNWKHCLNPRLLGNPSVSVKVFSEDGSQFLGTEQLIRYDIYSGQPCPQDGLDQWDFLGDPPYFACHHFHTGHH
jgi:hypothetical protein